MKSIMSVRNLNVEYYSFGTYKKALRDVNFDLYENEILGILGESGSGKSTVGFSLLKMIEPPHKIEGKVIYHFGKDIDLIHASEHTLNRYRWSKVAMIFQASMNSFDPLATIGKNFSQLLIEKGIAESKVDAKSRVIELLERFNLPKEVYNRFPFELSGGMKQRVSVAMSISCNPEILIADEPTTALDTVSQFGVLQIIKELVTSHKVRSAIFVTHDVTVEFLMADRIMIMLGGRIVEYGTKDEIRNSPKHPYTGYLLAGMRGNDEIITEMQKKKSDLSFNIEVSCPFVSQCEYATQICSTNFPEPTELSDTHVVFCHNFKR